VIQALAVVGLSFLLTACQAATPTSLPAPTSTAAAGMATAGQESPALQQTVAPETVAPTPSFPSDRVATRVVIPGLKIDLPVMLQTANYGTYPLCDVALYFPQLGQPGQGRATYIYAHARVGMFLPLLTASLVNNGQAMFGDIVEVYTSDSYLFTYRIVEVDRHALDMNDAFAARTEEVFLQTSEGPHGTVPKLQVLATFVSAVMTDSKAAHPAAHPRRCA
jgi:Sortase family.